MVIYESIFQRILDPFAGMGDDDILYEEMKACKDDNDMKSFIKKRILSSFECKNIIYINSSNIQATLCYYLHPAERQKFERILSSNLISDSYFINFYNALYEIYNDITKHIGSLNIRHADFSENTEYYPSHLYYAKDARIYMNK